MNDSDFHDIREPLDELRTVTPPHEIVERAMARARESIVPRRRPIVHGRAVVGIAASLAAAAAIAVSVRPPMVAPPPSVLHQILSASQKLQQAVDASNTYRGVVTVEMSEAVMSKDGRIQTPMTITSASINTASELPIMVWEAPGTWSGANRSASHLKAVEINSRAGQANWPVTTSIAPPGAVTMLIPLKWQDAQTIPIPLRWDALGVAPLPVTSPGNVTVSRKDNYDIYRIAEKTVLDDGLVRSDDSTVWVDSNSGLIDKIELDYDQGAIHRRKQIFYDYINAAKLHNSLEKASAPTTSKSGGR